MIGCAALALALALVLACAVRGGEAALGEWLSCQIGQECAAGPPRLAAALMVRDEQATLPVTLATLGAAGVRLVLVYDTGSVDETERVVREWNETQTQAHVEWRAGEFVDFATSRNVLLEWAAGRSEWLLLLDAGDELVLRESAAALDAFLARAPAAHCGYRLEVDIGVQQFFSSRLVRNDAVPPVWRYVFPVHEYITTVDGASCSSPNMHRVVGAPRLSLRQNRTLTGATSPARWVRDAAVLADLLAAEPDNTRAAFYLGNTYRGLAAHNANDTVLRNDYLERAVDAHLRRVVQGGGFEEEIEDSMIQLTRSYRALDREHEMRRWAMLVYHKHQRIEGLLVWARYAVDVQNSPELCLALADLACKAPRVERTLFIDRREYDTFRWNLRRLCSQQLLAANNDVSR
jgi:hypothetical protein